jgi:hypothetical protein
VSTATLAGYRATSARLHVPAWGAPWADAVLDDEVELSGRVELAIADLTVSCTIVSGGPSKGRSSYRLVGGAGGWGRVVGERSYKNNDAGIAVASVLRDLAADAGETLAGDLPTTRVGPHWLREAGRAHQTLELLAPRGWYVDEQGRTIIGRRAATELAVEATLGPVDRARATVTLAAESIATVLPGVTVAGIEALDVLHEVTSGGLRSTIWGEGYAGGQLEDVVAAYVLRLFPWLRYTRGPFEYRVVDQEGERLTLQPVRVSLGLADIERVAVRPGVPGVRADVQLGSHVLVQFIEADPSRPAVVGFEDAEGGGFTPDTIIIGRDGADPTGPFLRAGEIVALSDVSPSVILTGLGIPGIPVKLELHSSQTAIGVGPPGAGHSRAEG